MPQSQPTQGSDSPEWQPDVPFEPYTDSPRSSHAETHARVQVEPVHQVGPRSTQWRQTLDNWTSWSRGTDDDDTSSLLSGESRRPKRSCRQRCLRGLLRAVIAFFSMLGFIQFISLACAISLSFFPDEYDLAAPRWMTNGNNSNADDITRWPTDISRDIVPLGCHSHNDYWRRVPLYSALQAGCIGVEADVWLFDDELYVGHTKSSLTKRRTLQSMYIEPLVRILERQNPITPFQRTISQPPHGVFDTKPDQTLVLLIDFKTDGAATWPAVVKQIDPLRSRGYLTYFNGQDIVPGPITVVGTGNTPFNLVTANSTYRDIFFDAPLDKLVDDGVNDTDQAEQYVSRAKRLRSPGQGESGMPDTITANTFNATNSFYASVSFKKSIGFPWPFHLTKIQMDRIREQIRIAHHHGLKVRYWSMPSWPLTLRNHIWRILAQEGVDILNVDDLVAATRGKWGVSVLDWWR